MNYPDEIVQYESSEMLERLRQELFPRLEELRDVFECAEACASFSGHMMAIVLDTMDASEKDRCNMLVTLICLLAYGAKIDFDELQRLFNLLSKDGPSSSNH